MSNNNASTGGVAISTVIAVVLMILKLCGIAAVQNISWWTIIAIWLIPLWIFLIIVLGVCIFSFFSLLIKYFR